ncbi:McrB family protein [Halobaculum rubrum]|uniref:McrB family protein n=1 Tax=Halobaculum rubrum TaxID=2872158 RepID=UPI001CA4382C|nr:AAA family ATPase [Halobaculum rubrum]QZX99814.1 AAA family ATPase [Halobaculum rubrum]QZX99851.1 AAA family ATPase [Halobaculum rubrum]
MTFWFILKMRGLKPGGDRVLINEENGEPLLDHLLRVEDLTDYIDADDTPYYDIFVGATRKESADKNYWQNNIGNFYQNQNASNPEKWLNIEEVDGEYYASYTDEFADYLGRGKDGFAPKGKQLEIPLIDMMAWYFRYRSFDKKPSYDELLEEFTNDLHLSQIELNLVFDRSNTDIDGLFEENLRMGEKKKELARFLADHLEEQQSGYSVDIEPSEQPDKFSERKRDTIIYSSRNTMYDTFDPSVDPSEDLHDAVVEDGKRNLILVGPPGTGKTHTAIRTAEKLGEETFFFQFHESYTYEDFVESYEPTFKGGEIVGFEPIQKGFIKSCQKAQEISDDKYVFVVLDEINRAKVSRVFGELFSLIEYREDITEMDVNLQTLYSGGSIVVPDNLVIIGTMNNLDKSTEDIEFALRRRFSEIEVPPSTNLLRELLREQSDYDWEQEEIDELARLLNIVNEKGDYPLGPTYFRGMQGIDDLLKVYRREIRPSIKQYFGEYREEQLETVDGFFELASDLELSEDS